MKCGNDYNRVILVDNDDTPLGEADKMEAHKKALLHRAISVFIFNSSNQMLLQKRAMDKYHSIGLWSNTACTHPCPGESNIDAAKRRLKEEMGLETELKKIFHFIYKEKMDDYLTEYEFDHVFIGFCDKVPVPNPEEVCDFRYFDKITLNEQIKNNPDMFTVWFRNIADKVFGYI
jgi:isopentenyl-diphosphate delta-isomerase